ncbi:MAG: Fic family protein [Olsenella sp.]|jgi:Fic family protein|nr:Fic family protein [Olsenella sp.]MCI1289713.1 Fic family protein [Olsenella sp.]
MLDQFVPGRQGRIVSNLSGKLAYNSFCPAPLQSVLPLELDGSTMRSIAECRAIIGEVQGMARFVPNVGMYLTMYVRKEALLSSQIEGTQCTFDDVLDPTLDKNASRDLMDVVNYAKATKRAEEDMKSLPLCTRLLRDVHSVLLAGVRGGDRNPGEVRTSQNWVGPTGCTLSQASYVPPNVEDLGRTLSDLENFINNEQPIDPIVKAGLAHYQFETAHPFLDGNGRVGRLLITLSLMNDGILEKPVLYPSYELKRRRGEYYGWLTRVREKGDYEGWIGFFSDCLRESALNARESMIKLAELHQEMERLLPSLSGRRSGNALKLLNLLEGNPIVDIPFVSRSLGISVTSASNLVGSFVTWGVLEQRNTKRQRYRTFSYERYLEILRAGDDPLD